MIRLIQFKPTLVALVVGAVIACLPLLPKAQAVTPPPDGAYPGGNTAEGQNALFSLTTGTYNTAAGWYSLLSLTEGSFNTAIGAGTLLANTGNENTAIGTGALLSNTTGVLNSATGVFALFNNTTGSGNTANGDAALFNNTTGINNTADGVAALLGNASGDYNTGVGRNALQSNDSGNENTALGFLAGDGVITASNVICIGANVAGADVSNSCYIGSIFGQTSSAGAAVFINSDGKLGTTTSSRRFKEEIKPMDNASEALFVLKPITFRYKNEIDSVGTLQFGLVAEEVEKVNPDLVVRDKDGKPYSVRYDAVNAMLLNEFLKEHRKIERLEKQIEALTAGLQRVSAQLEMNKAARQTVLNSQ
jgi:trimeric autotransporter adhesin